MKKFQAILLILSLFLLSCKKDPEVPGGKFVPGDLMVGIKGEADTKHVLETINALDFKIKQMQGFFYSIPLPPDSLQSLLSLLNTRPYIFCNGFKAYAFYLPSEKCIKMASSLFNMSPQAQSDFMNLIAQGNWTERHEDGKYLYLKIPNGSERYWLEELKKYDFVKWTELNSYVKVFVD